jgi:glucosamine--fructose-6-phosphate aminotransferase (isomerizing)
VSPAESREPGKLFAAEIREQPLALERLLAADGEIARIASIARERDVELVRMVGHGSSDNAASYGVYAFGLLPRWTAIRDSITLTVHYDTPIDLSRSMVIGLSQSGQTPDVLEYLLRARRAGAFTVAVTNEPDSELSAAAEATIPLGAGPEPRRRRTSTRSPRSPSSQAISPAAAPRLRTGFARLPGSSRSGCPSWRRRHAPWRRRSRTPGGCS